MDQLSKGEQPAASARRTASVIGCNSRKVDKIRKIRRDGTPEIQDDVRNDRISINKAYKLIRDMELGTEDSNDKVSARQVKAAKTLFSEENYTLLKDLGGDVGTHVNKAIEMYLRWLQDKENGKER